MNPALNVIAGERDEEHPARPDLAARAFTVDELAGEPAPPRPWHVRNMIPSRVVTLLQGDGGTGKSILALQLAVATVLGRPWLGQDVRRGNVLYMSAEDDRGEIHRRLDLIAVDYGVDFGDLPGLKVLDVTGQDAVLAAADRQGRLAPTELWPDFERAVEAWAPVLVIIDNLADVFAGEENARTQARQFIAMLQGCAARQDASLLLIGHPSLAGMASGTGSSGSTAWNNSVRSRLYLTRPSGDDGAATVSDARVLTVKKANYGPANVEIRLRWFAGTFAADQGGKGVLSGLDLQLSQARIDRAFLDLLASYDAQGRPVSHRTGHGYAPALFAQDPKAGGTSKAGFTAAMNRLFAAKEITVEESGPPSRRTQRIVRAKSEVGD